MDYSIDIFSVISIAVLVIGNFFIMKHQVSHQSKQIDIISLELKSIDERLRGSAFSEHVVYKDVYDATIKRLDDKIDNLIRNNND